MSAYIFFTTKRVPELRAAADKEFGTEKDAPGKPKHTEHMKTAGEEWGQMSDLEKKPFNDLAAADKIRAEREKQEYKDHDQYTKADGTVVHRDPAISKKTETEVEDSDEEVIKPKKVRAKKSKK